MIFLKGNMINKTKQFFYLMIAVVLLSGCVKANKEKGHLDVRAFLTDKDRSFYIFLSEKYSFVFTRKDSVDNINDMLNIYSKVKGIEVYPSRILMGDPDDSMFFGNRTKEKREYAKTHITFYITPNKSNIQQLKKYGFRKSNYTSKKHQYQKSFFLYGKYTLTDDGLMERYQKGFLKKPLKFNYTNSANSSTSVNVKETSEVIAGLGGIAVVAPLSVVGFGIIGVLGITAPVIKSVTD